MSGRKSTKKLHWFEVLNDFEKKHGNRYDYKYLEEDYKNSTTKVRIICKEHGVFKQLPSEHKNGSGCPFCSKTKKLTQDEVILRFIKKHNDRYNYSFVEYTTWSNNVKIICPDHEYLNNPHLIMLREQVVQLVQKFQKVKSCENQ